MIEISSDFESFEYSAPRNAHDAVFKRERTYRTVIEDDTDLISNKQMINDKMAVGNSDTSNKNKKRAYFRDDTLFGGSIKKGIQYSIDGTEIIGESLSQHKYSRLASSSYDYFNSRGKIDAVHEGLQNPKYDYIDDLKDFTVDEELSTIDNLVLYNSKTGETNVSYRGTTDNPMRTKSFLRDWRINGQIAGGKSNAVRVKQAQKQLNKVVKKYGKSELSLSGHSQGGHVSYEMGVANDIPSYSYNPAINMSQLKSAEKYSGNASKHVIFKTPLDFASPLAHDTKTLAKSNTSVKIVNNLVGKDDPLASHSIDQFAPTPKEITGEVVKVERRKIAGAVMHGVGTTVNVGLGVYDWGLDLNKDVNKKGSNITEKVADSTIDTAKDGEEFIVDNAIADASFALAGETFGASIVVGVGLAYVNDLAASDIAAGAKSAVRFAEKEEKKAEHSIGKTFKKIGNTITNWFT
jgi:hypothetical protein